MIPCVIICGHCGDIFRRIKWNNHGCKSTVWRCVSRVNKMKSCIDWPARTVHEEVIQAAVVTAVNEAWSRKDEILPQLKENIRAVLQEDSDAKDRIEDLSGLLDEQTGAITEYSDALVRRLIEKISVYDEALVVKFKSGLEITVDA